MQGTSFNLQLCFHFLSALYVPGCVLGTRNSVVSCQAKLILIDINFGLRVTIKKAHEQRILKQESNLT